MNVHCACLEWDFLWSVTKREKEQYRLPHNVVYKPADWPWKRQANLREEVQSMFLETGRQAGGGHVWVQVCIFMYTYMQVCTVFACICLQACVSCILKRMLVCVFVCAHVCKETVCFPHLRKDNVLHSTGEQSHYRSRNSSLEATALHVVWIDRASFSLRRAVEHSLRHYQCPAVQTSLPPYFSWGKK